MYKNFTGRWFKRRLLMRNLLVTIPLTLGSSHLLADTSWMDDWTLTGGYWGTLGQYHGSVQRDTHNNMGVDIHAEYLERFRLDAGYQRTKIVYQIAGFDLTQKEYYVGGQFNLFSDTLGGKIGLASHYIQGTNDDKTGVTDDVKAYTATVSYTPWNKGWYLDAGAAQSKYGQNFNVNQFTASAGIAFNNQFDWLQIKGYAISPDTGSAALTSTKNNTSADIVLMHWFDQKGWLKVDSLFASGMVGERQLAVDAATYRLQNLADIQTQSYSTGINFNIDHTWLIGLVANYSRYRNEAIGDNYNDALLYFNFSKKW